MRIGHLYVVRLVSPNPLSPGGGSATAVDNFASTTPVLETKSGMRVELPKGTDREGMSFIVGEVQLALKGIS